MNHEEPHVVDALVALCKELKVTCLVQVGAEDGYEAMKIQEATGCEAICIEADCRCLPCSTKLEFHCSVVGATDCVTAFYLHDNSGLSTTLPRGENEKRLDLSQVRLDTFCTLNGLKPDALIVDTEGTSLDVLEGCGKLLDGLKMVYAETQTCAFRPGIRLVGEIDKLLAEHGMVKRAGLPAYGEGDAQGNSLWVRK